MLRKRPKTGLWAKPLHWILNAHCYPNIHPFKAIILQFLIFHQQYHLQHHIAVQNPIEIDPILNGRTNVPSLFAAALLRKDHYEDGTGHPDLDPYPGDAEVHPDDEAELLRWLYAQLPHIIGNTTIDDKKIKVPTILSIPCHIFNQQNGIPTNQHHPHPPPTIHNNPITIHSTLHGGNIGANGRTTTSPIQLHIPQVSGRTTTSRMAIPILRVSGSTTHNHPNLTRHNTTIQPNLSLLTLPTNLIPTIKNAASPTGLAPFNLVHPLSLLDMLPLVSIPVPLNNGHALWSLPWNTLTEWGRLMNSPQKTVLKRQLQWMKLSMQRHVRNFAALTHGFQRKS